MVRLPKSVHMWICSRVCVLGSSYSLGYALFFYLFKSCMRLQYRAIRYVQFQEDTVSRVFAKHGLQFDIEMSYGRVGKHVNFPFIKPSSWVHELDKKGLLHLLIGLGPDYSTPDKAEPFLLDFWQKYRLCHGGHQVFDLERAGGVNLGRCVPCYLHGDEGITYKRDGALVVSFHSPIGHGVASKRMGDLADPNELNTSFMGHCFKTRFVLGTLLKAI